MTSFNDLPEKERQAIAGNMVLLIAWGVLAGLVAGFVIGLLVGIVA